MKTITIITHKMKFMENCKREFCYIHNLRGIAVIKPIPGLEDLRAEAQLRKYFFPSNNI